MRLLILLTLFASACYAASSDNSVLEPASNTKDPAPTTHALLSKLGLRRLRLPAAHHRKRLAEQARRRATGDSRMYVVKLPPNQHYYAHETPGSTEARTLPLSLHSNGKPARVYHWNLPVLQKLATENGRHQARLDDDVVDVENKSTWEKPQRPHPNSIDAPAYYVPVKPKKSSFRKYFSGNGKPKSFYVIDKDKNAAQYHRLLP